ncbi:hypothetical protein BD324DRAFT_627008 [Kockovaella imperatae]|uniref:DUF4185 domain-containing protein n=1 Tax=Kockovaella imperatae TaxID=4999 RepID=A0A1Y1UFE8_9TREE|nr:hypothetical protein BD324DRAFT_627008 [Kockovaella imperatae]ORX36742.1 hypothetical protein BD324DRAFT_627008 [Kockovaella imperatae]
MLSLLSLFTLLVSTEAAAVRRANTNPTVKSSKLVAVASDPHLTRDSGGSVKWGSRTLWTYRDTQYLNSDYQPVNFFSSSASYGAINSDGSVPFSPVPSDQPDGYKYPAEYDLTGDNKNTSFYTILPNECSEDGNQGGNCYNGSRYAIWEDYPPLVTEQSGTITGYTWVKRSLIEFLTNQIPNPSATLYKVTGTDDQQALPTVSVIDEEFWQVDQFAYGHYGNLVVDNVAYLYATNENRDIALAKVPIADIEEKSAYQFYVGGEWTTDQPSVDDTSAYIDIAGGGQGTFYYSEPWDQYVWLGQPGGCACPEFIVSVSSSPEGPWTSPSHVIDVPPGNYTGIGAYTMQAHPEFTPGPAQNAIYVTYTQQYNNTPYETPMYLIEWN